MGPADRASGECGRRGDELGARADPTSWDAGGLVAAGRHGLPHASRAGRRSSSSDRGAVVQFDHAGQAIAMATDSRYGMSTYIGSTQDIDHAIDARPQDRGPALLGSNVQGRCSGERPARLPTAESNAADVGRSDGWASVEELTETQMLIHREMSSDFRGRPARSAAELDAACASRRRSVARVVARVGQARRRVRSSIWAPYLLPLAQVGDTSVARRGRTCRTPVLAGASRLGLVRAGTLRGALRIGCATCSPRGGRFRPRRQRTERRYAAAAT